MSRSILSVNIGSERDTVAARQRARQIGRALGFDSQDQTRIATAVSEIARNAFNYAGSGKVEYILEGLTTPQLFIIKISDSGPGIKDLQAILDGRYHSSTGMGVGMIGARRLVDQFEVDSTPGKGTVISLKKLLPPRRKLVTDGDLARICSSLALEKPQDAFQELQHQNQELLNALEEIRERQAELTRLNRELEDTNRGVVALYAELDEKADHLRRADELKSRFLSNMSHEFRSPLNSILALSGLLLDRTDGDLTAGQDEQLGYVKRAAQDLLELVNDLLDLAKVEAGKIEAKPVEFEVVNLFAALRGMLRPLLLNQAVDLVFDDATGLPPVISDEGKVSQVLRNLISNALKFTEKGEVRISSTLAGPDQILFSVSDTGIGIAPENQERIFQDFAQVDSPIQRRVKGTGLGLPLSKKLATLLGGEITLHSVPGEGSVFTFRLPVHYQEVAPERAVDLEHWVLDPTSIPVLIVEDSPEMMLMYKSYLKGSGFQVFPAGTTREADDILDRIRPGVILLDIRLRSEDTWNFLTKLKGEPRTKDTPVMMASTIEDQAKGYHLGVDSYLVKPIERTSLIRELQVLTGQRPFSEILIIDDDERDRYLIKQQLRKMSVLTSEATNGREGIRKACESKPDVILLDLAMAGISGFETLDRLKAERVTEHIPVIIVTSQVLTGEERSRLMGKAFAIVGKGTERSALEDILRRTFRTSSVDAAPKAVL